VIVASYTLRGSTGFGAAAAMPLLALVLPIKLLVPVWTLLGIASSVTIVARDRHAIAVRELASTLPTGLIGIAIGLTLFKTLDAHTLAQGLGLVVAAYGIYAVWGTLRPPATIRPRATPPAPAPSATPKPSSLLPALAGIVGGAVGTTFGTMASVFYAIYFDAIRLPKDRFRATMSAMILTLSIVRGLGYAAVGEFGRDVLIAFALAFPLMLIGIFIGDRFHAGMSDATFRRLVGTVLIVSGLLLLVRQ
jgi:uncharacterized membrane protein YfcA